MDGRNVRVDDDGTVTYRASAIGGRCTRALVLSRLGYDERKPPEDMQRRFDEGHLHEGAVLEMMRREGWTIWDEQAEVTLMVSGKIKVVGHIDGKGAIVHSLTEMRKGAPYPESRIVEVKSQSKDEFQSFNVKGWDSGYFPNYKWQLSIYMLATGLPAVVVRKDRNSGTIAMEWVDEPFYSLRDIRARVLSIEVLAADGLGPEECGPERIYPCPFFYLPGHDSALVKGQSKDGVVPVARKMLTGDEAREIDKLARLHEMARMNEKVAKETKDSAKRQLVEAGEGASGLDLDTGTRVTFWEQRVGAKRLSADAERAILWWLWFMGVDVEKYREQSVAKMMRVTVKEPTTAEEGNKNDE